MDRPLFIGVYLPSHTGSNPDTVDTAIKNGFDMVASRILSKSHAKRVQAQLKSSSHNLSAQSISLGQNDTLIQPGPHINSTIAISSPWLELDSKDENIRNLSLAILDNEAAYASFCGINYMVVAGPKRRNSGLIYSQGIKSILTKYPSLDFSIHVQFCEEFADVCADSQTASPEPSSSSSSHHHDYLSIWDLWNTIRNSCTNAPNLKVALQLPAARVPANVLSRWYAEPVSMLIVPNSSFIPNQKKYPVFAKWAQAAFHQFTKRGPFVIVESLDHSSPQPDASPGPSLARQQHEFAGGFDAPLLYLRYLFQNRPQPSVLESFALGFEDVLQTPLHPLVDTLDSRTYEVFEKDPVKYDQYERSIAQAMRTVINRNPEGYEMSIAVVGAGRGAIVDRVLKASESLSCNIRIYAIEKNHCAYSYMLNRQEQAWRDNVVVTLADMRSLPSDHPKVDIIVSELLGSIGDNELAPECLVSIRTLLKDPRNGIVIPESHTCFISPVFCPVLHARAQEKSLEMPYVVMMDHSELVSTEIKPAWTFDYAYPQGMDTLGDFTRSAKMSFTVTHRSMIHGLAGFFESSLIEGIELSTSPASQPAKSHNLVSWFPLYLPLLTPISVPDNSQIDVYLWRQNNGTKVWYEWAVEVSLISDSGPKTKIASSVIHNSMGHAYSMSL